MADDFADVQSADQAAAATTAAIWMEEQAQGARNTRPASKAAHGCELAAKAGAGYKTSAAAAGAAGAQPPPAGAQPPPAEQLRSRCSTAAAHCTRCSSRARGKASRGGDERPQGSEQLQGDEDKRGGSGEGGSEIRNETEGEYDKGGEAWNVVTEYNE